MECTIIWFSYKVRDQDKQNVNSLVSHLLKVIPGANFPTAPLLTCDEHRTGSCKHVLVILYVLHY